MSVVSANLVRVIELVKRRAPVLGRLVPAPLRRRISDRLFDRAMMSFPDRIFLEEQIISFLASGVFRTVLSVGVERYTSHHPEVFQRAGVSFWTVDLKPENAAWGAGERHVVGDICKVDDRFEAGFFDAVLFNGVIGFGVNDPHTADRALAALAHLLRPGGLLVLGWNTDKGIEPLALPSARALFHDGVAAPFPAVTSFPGSTHVFNLLARHVGGGGEAGAAGAA